jgi:hypothetical protein
MAVTTTPGTDLVQAYLAAWNETDPAARKATIDAAFTPDARYVDPLADVSGADGLDALIAGVQQQFPRMEFRQLGDVDAHHDVCRFQWGLGPAGAEPLVIGFDVVAVAADGRITTVHGFLDRVPA